jgi:predicted acyltransferase (DUF342 family)
MGSVLINFQSWMKHVATATVMVLAERCSVRGDVEAQLTKVGCPP